MPRAARALGAAAVALAVLPFATRPLWRDAPLDVGVPDHVVTNLGLTAALVLTVCLPYLVLPVALPFTSRVDGAMLSASTILGRRTLDLTRLRRAGALEIMGRDPTLVLRLHDAGGGRLYLMAAPPSALPRTVRAAVRELAHRQPAAVSRRARVHLDLEPHPGRGCRLLLAALTTLAAVAWSFAVLVVGGVYLEALT